MARLPRSASDSLHQALSSFLRAHPVPIATVVVAVSGGPDSSALLHALSTLPHRPFELAAAHVNHHLRGAESEADENWTRAFCNSLALPLQIIDGTLDEDRIRTRGIEAAARELRYERLRALRKGDAGAWIATAHHASDQAETLLLRLATGRGPWRLTGIQPVQDGLIRPFLHVDRDVIEAYLAEHRIDARSDSSNDSPRFVRNRIRNELLPVLRSINPRVVRHLGETAELEQEREAVLATVLSHWSAAFERGEASASARIDELPIEPLLRRALLRAEIRRIDPDERYLDVPALKRLEELFEHSARLRPSRKVELVSDGVKITVRRVVERLSDDYEYPLVPGETIEIQKAGWRVAAAHETAIPFGEEFSQTIALPSGVRAPITVRNRRRGDRFRPLGLGFEKKLSDFFIDRKIPQDIRDLLPLVVIDGRIAWIAGTEVSDDFRLGRGDTERLVLCASRLGNDR
ncbi:MAG: tRNA lysidine(34) synthetase TilS [Thermoanaerobaculia bacterium]